MGESVEDDTEIISCNDGTRPVNNYFGYSDIRLYTCINNSPGPYRWVVIGQLIE